MIESKNYQF